MKVLIFIILLSTLNFVKFSKSLNLTYVLKQRKDHFEPNCIAEQDLLDSPIGWIYPISEKLEDIPKSASKFVPNVNSNYSCTFEDGDPCINRWRTDKWALSTDYSLTLDTRWENFPKILTTNKTGKAFLEVHQQSFRMGFSVRSAAYVELLLCEGWNVKSYPCYYIHIGDSVTGVAYLKKIKSVNDLDDSVPADAYKHYTSFLFEDEWRNFELSSDRPGRIELFEVFSNQTVINYTDSQPLNLLYVFPRSQTLALWKLHKNQFLSTKKVGTFKLGSSIETPSSILCISLYVSLCDSCSMSFSVKEGNSTREIENVVKAESGFKWTYLKLLVKEIQSSAVDVYAELKSEGQNNNDFFWAIDDVRVCSDKEIKISTLFLKNKMASMESDEISCQSVLHQKWRPVKHIHPYLPVFPGIESAATNTTVELAWIPNTTIISSLIYLVHYQADDVCTKKMNRNRLKSSGYIITKDHKATIQNLIPYTHYNIEFSYILEDKIKNISLNTRPTETPTKEEIPTNILIEPSEYAASLRWKKPSCQHIYGPLLYLTKVWNVKKNYSQELQSADSVFKFGNLQPYTTYQAQIFVARSHENFFDDRLTLNITFNFTTSPAVAPPVRNLEAYSIDAHSISLRYDLPEEPHGSPAYVQVSWYDALMKTQPRAIVTKIKRCALWPQKHCVGLENLVAQRLLNVFVSLKNTDTHKFGEEKAVQVFTTHDRIPGKPSNLTYKVVDCSSDSYYCHLNVSWAHPFEENTTITSFNIYLNRTTSNKLSSHIMEVLKIFNATYQPTYHFQIKYIPYSATYLLSVQSVHDEHRSDLETIPVKTDDIGDHIDQSPSFKQAVNSTLVFEAPALDHRLNETVLLAIVQDYDESKTFEGEKIGVELHEYDFCNGFGEGWIAEIIKLTDEPQELIIGDGTTKFSPELKRYIVNKPLLPNKRYCLTFIVRNKYEDTEHEVVYYEKDVITGSVHKEELVQTHSTYLHLYILFVMLLMIPVAFFLYRYMQKRKARKMRSEECEENVYESLPFEECDNCAYNRTYDKLMHT